MKPETNIFPEVWAGLECSINRVGNTYFNQLNASGHFLRPDDISAFIGLGIKKIRYPLLWEQHQPCKDQNADFSISSSNLEALKNAGVEVIAGLVHHGSGPEYVNILDNSFVDGLEKYAAQVALNFPWINWFTPVNEPLTTARFCGLYGLWYPHQTNAGSFCRILINELKATVLAMRAIRRINPDAQLLHTDDLGKTHSTALLQYQADFENNRRWLSYDLLCGRVNRDHPLWSYLITSGIEETELDFFSLNCFQPSILGFNHYLTSERYLDENMLLFPEFTHGGNGIHSYADVEAVRVGHICPDGLSSLLQQAWARYELPLAVTEVHLYCTREEQMRWLDSVWETAKKLRSAGIDIIAVTPWALLGSFDWNSLLTKASLHYEPGVFDLVNFMPRATILAEMIRAYSQHQSFHHPVLLTQGWWRRSCRTLYGKDLFYSAAPDSLAVKAICIIGESALFQQEARSVCSLRGLKAFFQPLNSTCAQDGDISMLPLSESWAVIFSGSLTDPSLQRLADECHKNGIRLLIFSDTENVFFLNLHKALLVFTEDLNIFLNTGFYHGDTDSELLGNFRKLMNSSLDLLLDQEQGYWVSDQKGLLVNQVKGIVQGIEIP